MKQISLSKGKYALVDDEDFEYLNQWKWTYTGSGNCNYAYRTGRKVDVNKKTIFMHRVIVKAERGYIVDHLNGDGLDNRKSNLRFCTYAQNCMNRKPRSGSISGYKGVSFHKSAKKWIAYIGIKGKLKHIGYFDCSKKAAKAYNVVAKEYFGEFAKLNDI